MASRSINVWKSVDKVAIVIYLILVFFGWVSIYAAGYDFDRASIFDFAERSGKQLLWIALSFVIAAVILSIEARFYETYAYLIYISLILLLIATIFVAPDIKGSHSWFELGPVKFQPAEVSKITTSLMLALVMGRQGFRLVSPRCFLQVALVIGLPMLAILGESETGSALVYLGYMFVLYREGLSGWWLFAFAMAILLFILTLTAGWWLSSAILTAVCALCCLMLLRRRWKTSSSFRRGVVRRTVLAFIAGAVLIFATRFIFENVLQDHQRSRIEVLLGMKEDPSGVGYNVRQSMIAIGSGGFSGKGFLNGTQTTFGFVPEQSTDFIFCTIGEEHGFVGCFVVIFLYVFMIYRIMQDADRSREAFTRIYGNCLAACLFMHLFINIGMTIGLMPVIGIPLPLLSYGGSSLLAFSVLLFIFLALNRQENKYF